MPRALRAASLLLLVLLPAQALGVATPARRPAPRASSPVRRATSPARKLLAPVGQIASQARMREDDGDYAAAMLRMRELRGRLAPDADLELALALNEARCGQLDSAWTRLSQPLMNAAMADSADLSRRHDYHFTQREGLWRNGAFDGWYWYIARARAEVALESGRYGEAFEAARAAALARPMAGKEQLLFAVAAGRAGKDSLASAAARRATVLDPTLPEAHYLAGLWAWRAGDRAGARASFESAIGCDSAFRAAALSLVRLRLPGSRPDSLPATFLTGRRQIALLTTAMRPKQEETPQHDQPAGALGAPAMTLSDAMKARLQLTKPIRLFVTVLVDETGRPVLNDLPWMPLGALPDELVGDVTRLSGTWRFRPAQRLEHPIVCWATLELPLKP